MLLAFWPLTASITSEVKNNCVQVTMEGILNKISEIKFSVRFMVWPWCRPFQIPRSLKILIRYSTMETDSHQKSSIMSRDQIEQTNYHGKLRSPGGQWVQNLIWFCCLLGGILKLPWQCFDFYDHLTSFIDIFQLMKIDKQSTFLYYLLTSLCENSLRMPCYLEVLTILGCEKFTAWKHEERNKHNARQM